MRITHYPLLITLLVLLALPAGSVQAQFDHEHAAWTALLKKHVVLVEEGKASQVRYAGFQQDRAALKSYLGSLSKVTQQEFNGWGKAQQVAFLINAPARQEHRQVRGLGYRGFERTKTKIGL